MNISPIELLKKNRFDVLAKYLYGKYRTYDTSFATDLYKEHLRVWNNFNELDNNDKNSFADFSVVFDELIDDIRLNGFDITKGTVPVTNNMELLNGSHRLAACILSNCDVGYHIAESENEGQFDCSSFYFQNKGLNIKYLDMMATEYVKLKSNTFIVSLFPSAVSQGQQKVNEAYRILQDNSNVVYLKHIPHENNGPLNIVRQLYLGEEWGLSWESNFSGFVQKAKLCFTNSSPAIVFLVELENQEDAIRLKDMVRRVFGIGKHSCHINDYHEETVRLARVFFNDNSVHYMNNASFVHYPKFYEMLNYYRKYIDDNDLNSDDFCVTASSILSLYGLREGNDLDYLHGNAHQKIEGHEEIHSHNGEIYNYTKTIDDIVYNPENYFYFDGIKFASPWIIKWLKEKRGESKDMVDIQLLSSVGV